MAATGKTSILLYGSTTATNAPVAGNLTNSNDGCEIAINVADKNLFFKDSTNVVNTVPIRQSSASSNGWLSSTDWTTFNNKASTSSPTFSGDVTLSTGNLVIGTSGKGIDFSATPGTGTSELLADYEEGTWTPSVASTTGSITSYNSYGVYRKVGSLVTCSFYVQITNNGTGAGSINIGLPFSSISTTYTGIPYFSYGDGQEIFALGYRLYATLNSNYSPSVVNVVSTTNLYPGTTLAVLTGSITYISST